MDNPDKRFNLEQPTKGQLRQRLYKNLASEPKERYDQFEKRLLQPTSATSSLNNIRLIPKVTTRSRLEPLPATNASTLGVTISQGRILVDRIAKKSSVASLQQILDSKHTKSKNLSPMAHRFDNAMSIVDNEHSSIHPEDSIIMPKKRQGKALRKGKEKQTQMNYLTPMDFIYLIRTDPEMADEFCYLNKRDHPYDYQIVEFEERNQREYMTISSRGIMNFLNDEATFLTIEEWQRECNLFHNLHRIDFFKKYKIWKNFFLWKRLMRKNIMKKNQDLMNQRLFAMDKQLRVTTLEVRRLCQMMASDLRFLDTSFSEPQGHEQFKLNQDKHLMSNMDLKFDGYESQIRDIVMQCCQKSLITFKEVHRIPLREDDDGEERAPLLVGDESGKDMPYTTEATIRTHYKRLRKFVKYIDYLIADAKMLMMTNSVEQISRQVKDFNDVCKESLGRKRGGFYRNTQSSCWIIVEAICKGDEITFTPSREQMVRIFEEITTKCVTRITTRHKELISMPELQPYIQDENQGIAEKVDLKAIILQSEQYQIHTLNMKRELDQAFEYVEQYAQRLKPFVGWYLENTSINIVESYQDKEVDDYRNAINRYRDQDQEFQSIEPTSDIGVVLFDNQKLKESIKYSAINCVNELQRFIPDYIYNKAIKFTQQTQLLYNTIAVLPTTVEQFVQYMEAVNVISNKFEDLGNESSEITSVSLLMDEIKIKIPDRYRLKFQECNQQVSGLRKKVDDAMAGYDQNLNRFRKDMERMIPQIDATVKDLTEKISEQPLGIATSDVKEMVTFVTGVRKNVDDLKFQAKKLNDYQLALQMEYTPFEKLELFTNDFILIEKLWCGRNEWLQNYNTWTKQHFTEIVLEDMVGVMEKLQKAANLCAKELDKNEMAKLFKQDIESFKGVFQVLQALKDPAIVEKQWGQIRALINENQDLLKQNMVDPFAAITDPKYTVDYIIKVGLDGLKEKLSEIALKAAKEIELVKMLEQVEAVWRHCNLTVQSYRDSKEVYILGNNEDLIGKIDDTLLTVNNILSSRFVEGIRADVEKQQSLLRYFQELLDEWMLHQRNWLYLEPILNSPYSVKNLAKETKIFQQADSQWKRIMRTARDQTTAKKWAEDYNSRQVFNNLRQNNNNFDLIQKALDDFLEKKREVFQRFFFLSNDELLEILSNAKSLQAVQPYLRKCFENIVKLQFDVNENVTAMISAEGETTVLRGYGARGSEVEEWLKLLEEKMKSSLGAVLRNAYLKYSDENTQRKDWVLEFPLQVVITIDSVYWTKMTEENYLAADAEGELDDWYDVNVSLLDELTQLIRGNLTDLQRRTLVALVTQDVHFRDIIDHMRVDEVEGIMDFKWQQQLRFYYEDEAVFAKQVNAKLMYGYEYLGSTTRLVITPLTDRCWMTITGALGIKLGAAPQGPAGTGKTESCKDLAKALGRYCIVFNCSDQITAKMMEKLFTGLAYCGAWVCLDEFNRIYIEVLSVIAQQVQTIRDALLESKQVFSFFTKNVTLNPDLGIFITMNPGYAGRTELPDNLKVLFRPVAMMVPDYRLIAEIMLFAEGFSNAKELSSKMTKLYQLSSEQLSQQDHYDFGMRAVKSVLVMAGSLKRAEPNVNEDIVLIRAMRESNLPKFLSHDIPLFNAIVSDLFPGLQIPKAENKELENVIKYQIEINRLQPVPNFIEKIVQLHETLKVRFGVMLVGVTMGGKSQVIQLLRESYSRLFDIYKVERKQIDHPVFQNVEFQTLNPKSISMEELYGQFDIMTQQWTDGLASNIMRDYSSQDTLDKKWVIFDGPVDALWIENMNTVLDDSMTLCLSNGERIKLKNQMRMLFEVLDLAVASPATVSRCGMVYLDSKVLGYEAIMTTEALQLNDLLTTDVIDHLLGQIRLAFNKAVAPILKQSKQLIPVDETQMAVSVMRIIRMIILHYNQKLDCNLKDELTKKHIEKIFVWVFSWAVGATLISDDFPKFERIVGDTFTVDQLPRGSSFHCLAQITKLEGVVDVHYKLWQDMIPDFQYNKEMSYFDLVVQTNDTVAHGWFLEQAVNAGCPIFITGLSGTGKTVLITSTVEKMRDEGLIALLQMTYSAKTSAFAAQMSVESKMQSQRKKGRTILMPPPGKKFVLFVDDVNMPATEMYGAQPPIELLRQFVDYKGVYDRKTFMWKDIDSTILFCACAPPGGGRSPLTVRFTRHFTLLSVPNSSDETLTRIFSTILKAFFKQNYFKNEIIDLGENNSIVQATLQMYGEIQKALLPTPERSHYVFNLRDVSKIFQGILQAKPLAFQKGEAMVRLWAHETCRVLMDRLINHADQDWFKETLVKNIFIFFKIEYKVHELFESKPPLLFADFLKRGVEIQDRVYEEVRDYTSLVKIINEYMMDQTKMSLVLFKDAIEHVVRIARVLRQQRGHYMLVGVGGSGKKSLTQLGAVLAGCQVESIESKKNYSKKEFKEDLFRMMCLVGIENKPVAFSFSDTQILQEGFLEDVNNLLNSGEVPNMLNKEDLEYIQNNLATEAREQQINDIYPYFVAKVRSNLHVVLGLSPIGAQLRVRLRMFPSLVNCCTIEWLQQWPQEALLSVAEMFLETLEFEGLTKELRISLYNMCMFAHQSVEKACGDFYAALKRNVYVTPKSYIDLIESYKQLLQMKREELFTNKQKLSSGLNKLAEANSIISDLKIKLTDLAPILKQKTIEQDELLKKLQKDSMEANKVKQVVSEEERQVNEKANKIKEMKAEADKILNDAMPILLAATEALNTLNRNDISEIKSNNNPQVIVKFTLECVAVLFEEKVDWDSIKKLLADPNFLSRMKNMNVGQIKLSTQTKIKQKIATQPGFIPVEVAKVSVAAKSICEWVRAVSEFTDVNNDVEKKKSQVEGMNQELDKANKLLKVKQDELAVVVKKVTDLENLFNKNKQEKDKLDQDIQTTEVRLIRAEELTVGLADEQERWKEKVEQLGEEIKLLLGNVFMAGSTVCYLGPFTGLFRNAIVQQWIDKAIELNIPISEKYNFEEVLGDALEIQNWASNGLPNDSVSKANGIIQKYSRSYPMFIDPQLQASVWIKNLYREQNLKILKITQEGLVKHLENAVQTGIPLLLEDVQELLDNVLEPLLLKQFNIVNRRKMIKIGDREVECDPNFKLFIATKLANPQFLPEIFIRVAVINFTVTEQGLEEQLLGEVVSIEKPEMEIEKRDLVKRISQGNMNLKRNEEKILTLLANSKGMILDNVDLIENLKISKIDAIQVKENLVNQEQKSAEIEIARQQYVPVATRGSILYFVIADFAMVDPMYQFSLNYFKRLFQLVIRNTEPIEDMVRRIKVLMDGITETIYLNVCRGLFNPHKRIFSFLIAAKIQLNNKAISAAEWNLFIRGASLSIQPPAQPATVKVSPKQWNEMFQLSTTNPNFTPIYQLLCTNFKEFETLISMENPWNHPILQMALTPFQKLMLIKILREEESLYSMSYYLDAILGKKFTSSVAASIEDSYNDTDHKTPFIFILSQGADPLASLTRLAQAKKMNDKVTMISLGQGQGVFAEKAIDSGIKNGGWVILQNCHLGKSFMPQLEKKIENFEDPDLQATFNTTFRLILTSMPCDYFPVSVLQNGVKLTTEPPKGIKSNMFKSYSEISQEYFESGDKPGPWKKLLFSLAFFHAIVQERRKFGPLGWNIRYEFNDSDFETSFTLLRNFLDMPQEIPWDAITYVIGEITYGGRVTDDWDRRCLLTILSKYINEEALNNAYNFSESGTYKQQVEGSLEAYRDCINQFPDFEKPEVFGMNENANITFKLTESKLALSTILSIQPRDVVSSSDGVEAKTPDQMVLELCEILASKLPFQIKESDKQQHGKKSVIHDKNIIDIDSLKVCLNQEISRFNRLLSVISSSLKQLQQAIKGEVVMSAELDRMYSFLLNNQVPQIWASKAYPSLKPLASFYDDMIKRVQFFRDWFLLEQGYPKGYWISAFFFPQGFLTSVLQTYARDKKIAIDILGFSYKFFNFVDIDTLNTGPEYGAYIYGLYVEGCRYDLQKQILDDSLPGVTVMQAPVIHFIPFQNYKPNPVEYSMPLYKTSLRAGTLSTTGHSTNFIRAIECPTKKNPEYWVLNGAAFTTQLND